MQLIRYRKINIEVVLQLIILIGFAFFFSYIILTGKVLLYVTPRIVPYVKFGIAAMILLSLFIAGDVFKPKRKANVFPYLFFIVPLFMAFILPAKVMDSTSMSFADIKGTQQTANTINSSGSNNNITNQDKTTNDNSGTTANTGLNSRKEDFGLEMQGDTVVISGDNFVRWMQEIYDNMSTYEGKKIQITGFVFKDEAFNKNEFVTARLMMSCCSADLQPVGLLCRYDKAAELNPDLWINLTGKIQIIDYKGEKTPVVISENIEKTEKPQNDYVYPY